MTWESHRRWPGPTAVSSVDELLKRLGEPPLQFGIYRGEPRFFNSHRACLARYLEYHGIPERLQLTVEVGLVQQFWHSMNPHLDPAARAMAEHAIGVLTLMQHHGAPTRLLDWTRSVWVALYHACADPTHRREPGYIWGFSSDNWAPSSPATTEGWLNVMRASTPGAFKKAIELLPQSLTSPDCVAKTDRMLAQQSIFTAAQPATADHLDLIANDVEVEQRTVILIPPDLKQRAVQMLHEMNVSARTLFPGLDGLGRAVRDVAAWQLSMSVINHYGDRQR